MYALDNSSGVTVMPPVKSQQYQHDAPRWFTEGGNGIAPSYPGADWFNIVQAELLNILTEAGIEPTKNNNKQLAQSIIDLAKKHSLSQFSQSLESGWCKLPNGLVIQWGSGTSQSSESGALFKFPLAFTKQCFSILATDVGGGTFAYGLSPVNNAEFKVWSREIVRGALAGGGFRWLAVGV